MYTISYCFWAPRVSSHLSHHYGSSYRHENGWAPTSGEAGEEASATYYRLNHWSLCGVPYFICHSVTRVNSWSRSQDPLSHREVYRSVVIFPYGQLSRRESCRRYRAAQAGPLLRRATTSPTVSRHIASWHSSYR